LHTVIKINNPCDLNAADHYMPYEAYKHAAISCDIPALLSFLPVTSQFGLSSTDKQELDEEILTNAQETL